jgi:putative membrane protein
MKTINSTILKTNLFAVAFVGIFSFMSCSQNAETKDTKEIAEDSNDQKFSDAKEDDAEFLVSAAEINLEEIELGQLAQKNSTMPDVIELGKMMEAEHVKALQDLQTLASKKQITIPTTITDDGKDAYNKLKDKKGSDFDNDYCDMMVKGHKYAISKFEKAATDAKDAEIKSWAITMLPALRTHLEHSTVCEDKCKQIKSKS